MTEESLENRVGKKKFFEEGDGEYWIPVFGFISDMRDEEHFGYDRKSYVTPLWMAYQMASVVSATLGVAYLLSDKT